MQHCVLGREAVELEHNSNGHRREKFLMKRDWQSWDTWGWRGERKGNEIRIKIIEM